MRHSYVIVTERLALNRELKGLWAEAAQYYTMAESQANGFKARERLTHKIVECLYNKEHIND